MKIFKYLAISLISLIVIAAAGFLYIWMGTGDSSFNIPKIMPELKIEGVHLTRAVAGKAEWEITATSADYFREEGVTRLKTPEVVFFGSENKRIKLTGNKGEVFNNTNDVTISGDVTIVTSDGYTLHSDNLNYFSDKRIVTTESRVFVKGNGIDMEGMGMVADMDRGLVFIKKNVKAVLEVGLK